MAPLARLLADHVYVHIVDQRSLDQLRGVVAPGEGGTSWAVFALYVVPVVVGVLGFLLVLRLRAAASAGFVERAIASGRVDSMRSPSARYTAGAWALLVAGVGGGFGVGMLAAPTATDPEARRLYELAGGWRGIVLGMAAFGVAVGVQAWSHRRRHEVEPLIGHGLIERVEPPQVEPATGVRAFTQGLHAFVSNLWIAGLFLAAGWLQAWIDGDALEPSQMVFDGLLNVFVFPVAVALGLMAVLWLSPLRWAVRACLRDGATRAGLGLFVGGSLAGVFADGHWAPTTAAGIGGVIIAVTMLRLMDLGPQPWLGIIFLGLSWWFGASYDVTNRQNSLPLVPVSILGWVAAIAALVFVVVDVRRHWLSFYGTRTVADSP